MLSESSYNKPKQKMIFSKDSSLNFGGQKIPSELLGHFKSSSSLARSIRSTSTASSTLGKSLQSTGAMILEQQGKNTLSNFNPNNKWMSSTKIPQKEEEKNKTFSNGWNIETIKAETPRNQMDIKIRNIIHNYTDIDTNDFSYDVLSNLKSKKRMQNLDVVEVYEIWKTKYLKDIEENVKKKISELKDNLNNTKNEVYKNFTMNDNDLIPLIQKDIDNIAQFYYNVLKERQNSINECLKNIMDDFDICYRESNLKLVKLADDMDKIGYLFEEEIRDLINEKKQYIQRFTDVKKNYYNRIMNEIKSFENELVEKSKKDLNDFILRWKNIKLNNYVSKLQKLLRSKEYTDPEERALLVQEVKQIQEDSYKKKHKLIFENLFKLDYDDINTKHIEKIGKEYEKITNETDKLYTQSIEKLNINSKNIEDKSIEAFEKFKADVSTINYIFGQDNHNEKKYNDYDDLNTLEELFQKEVNSVLDKNKSDRMNYILNLNKYLEEYEEFLNNICEKIISIYLAIGKLYDEHKRDLKKAERNYMISYAKECDNDDNIIHEKELELKKISEEMKNCINKEELDKGLQDSFQIMDQLEKEYRDFFQKIDDIFNSHEGILTQEYHNYEKKILNIFGIYPEDNLFYIEKRRNKESDFLSKKKEAQIAEEERKESKKKKKQKRKKKQERKNQRKKKKTSPN